MPAVKRFSIVWLLETAWPTAQHWVFEPMLVPDTPELAGNPAEEQTCSFRMLPGTLPFDEPLKDVLAAASSLGRGAFRCINEQGCWEVPCV